MKIPHIWQKRFYKEALCFLLLFLIASCSLKYDEENSVQDNFPELEFLSVSYKKYEDGELTTEVTAEKIEQYKGGNEAYAKNAQFKAWNKEQEILTEGSCDLIAANTDTELYSLFGKINIDNHDQNFHLSAESLKWNGKTEQLTSDTNGKVKVYRDDIEIEGQGFSASGVSQSFAFEKPVSGIITTEEDEDNESEAEEEEDDKE